MTRKSILAFLCISLATLLAQAHEFWVQPDKFRYTVGDTARLNFMVGENFTGDRWKLNPQRFLRFDHHAANYTEGLIEQLNTGEGNNVEVKLTKAGSHLFVMQSTNAFIELEAEKFNDYLKEDGLEDVLTFRQKNNQLDKAGKEFYARCTKLLLQAGPNSDDTYKKVVGMPLEIVPENDPYRAKTGDHLVFRVLFEGKPLPFAMVKVWNRKDGTTFMQNIYTKKDGTIDTRLSNNGSWMVSCVKMIPSRDEGADWQSYWASYVFGY